MRPQNINLAYAATMGTCLAVEHNQECLYNPRWIEEGWEWGKRLRARLLDEPCSEHVGVRPEGATAAAEGRSDDGSADDGPRGDG